MNNSEFETRAYANPDDQEQDFLDALKEDPSRQQLLEEIRAFNQQMSKTMNGPTPPEGLADRLKSLAIDQAKTESNVVNLKEEKRFSFSMRTLALAASLVLAVGVTYSVLFNNYRPSDSELAFGELVIDHVIMELEELSISQSYNYLEVNQVIDTVGAQLHNASSLEALAVTFAKPCIVLPDFDSAHIALLGSQGTVNVIVVNNSPVNSEFAIGDDRFSGVVIPMEDGNLILLGEKQERLDSYRQLLADNTTWVI